MGMLALGPDPRTDEAVPAQLWVIPDDQVPLITSMLIAVLGPPAADYITAPAAAEALAATASQCSVLMHHPDDPDDKL